MNLKSEICNSFARSAKHYDDVSKIQQEIGWRLFERLDIFKMTPHTILDAGCGTGIFARALKERYQEASLFALDFSEPMLQETREKTSQLSSVFPVLGDMEALPFENASFDLIFVNQAIHWSDTLSSLLGEFHRVLKEDGILLFSTLGPDTFLELREAFLKVDGYEHTNSFYDMHDIGDLLLSKQFEDVVIDMERIEVHYDSPKDILVSLKRQGVRNLSAGRNPGLMKKSALSLFKEAYQAFCLPSLKYPLTYEVIYGHAISSAKKRKSIESEMQIDANSIVFRSTRSTEEI